MDTAPQRGEERSSPRLIETEPGGDTKSGKNGLETVTNRVGELSSVRTVPSQPWQSSGVWSWSEVGRGECDGPGAGCRWQVLSWRVFSEADAASVVCKGMLLLGLAVAADVQQHTMGPIATVKATKARNVWDNNNAMVLLVETNRAVAKVQCG